MTETARNLLAIAVWIAVCVAIALAATAYESHAYRADCDRAGGVVSTTDAGWTLTCHYRR